jgi:hypothetical protein
LIKCFLSFRIIDDFVISLAACTLGPSSARELTLVSARELLAERGEHQ